jgi:hypothetical protein
MRDQYAGDVSDVLKFSFLRALAGADRTLGVAWYYAPGDDGRLDGRHLEWRDEPAWRELDPVVYTGLGALPERSVAALEAAAIWPVGRLFHREPIPSRGLRPAWSRAKREALVGADIVFLDPDNGLGGETPKHATYAEVRLLRRPGRAIVFITFPGRSTTHEEQVRQMHARLATEADANRVITLRTNVSVPRGDRSGYFVQRPRWFTVVDPDGDLTWRVEAFAEALRAVPRVRAVVER